MAEVCSCAFQNKGQIMDRSTHYDSSTYPPPSSSSSSFSLKRKWSLFVPMLEQGTAVTAAHLQVGKKKRTKRGIVVTVTKKKPCRHSDLWPAPHWGNINKRKWEKEVERGREWSFLASSSPLHLTLLLIVCSNKGGWQRWCCSIDRLVMGGDERAPGSRWMGQLECSCKMTVLRERQQRLVCKHTRIFSHTSGAHEYASAPVPLICTVLIKPGQVDMEAGTYFSLLSPTCSGHSRHVN